MMPPLQFVDFVVLLLTKQRKVCAQLGVTAEIQHGAQSTMRKVVAIPIALCTCFASAVIN